MRTHLTTRILAAGLLLLPLVLTTAPASAQSGLTARERSAVDAEKARVARASREAIESLFSRLCPGRCELVDVVVEMEEPEPLGEVTPGFEAVTGGSFATTARSITPTVLLDSKLPRNFQSNLPRMIAYRLQGLAPTVDVRPEVLDFPEPQLQPMPPMMPESPRRGWPPMEPAPAPMAAEPAPTADDPAGAAAAEDAAAAEAANRSPLLTALAPWLGPILMVLILFALMLVLLRRMGELSRVSRPSGAAADAADASPGAARREIDVEALRAELMRSRAVRNRVLRRWLAEDAEAEVAALVRLVGPEVLGDLKADPALRGKLQAVSELVAQRREPLAPTEVAALAGEVEARLAAARVLHEDQGLQRDWEFLEGLGVTNLRRILRSCSTNERVYVVGKLPPSLRSSYLEALPAPDRRDLFLGAGSGLLDKDQAISLAARLRRDAEALDHLGGEDHGQAQLVVEMLRALPLDDQEESLRELRSHRPEVADRVLDDICLETTCLQVPGELLADATHRTPIDTLASFLRGTRADVRDHVLSMAPAGRRGAVMTELSLDVPVGRADFLEAREIFTDALRDVLRRDGHDVSRANLRALMGGAKLNPVTSPEAT